MFLAINQRILNYTLSIPTIVIFNINDTIQVYLISLPNLSEILVEGDRRNFLKLFLEIIRCSNVYDI